MNAFSIDLTPEEINKVLSALGNLPYIQVHDLINKIKDQAEEQLQVPRNSKEVDIDKEIIHHN